MPNLILLNGELVNLSNAIREGDPVGLEMAAFQFNRYSNQWSLITNSFQLPNSKFRWDSLELGKKTG